MHRPLFSCRAEEVSIRQHPSRHLRPFFAAAAVLAAAFLLLLYQEECADTVLDSLSVCADRLLPALFPFLVLSSLTVSLRLLDGIPLPMRLMGLPSCASPVLLTGLLFGFPNGAAGCSRLVLDGRLSESDASRLLAVSCGASPAFLIGTVGTLWGDKGYGCLLFLAGIPWNLLAGQILGKTAPAVSSIPRTGEKSDFVTACSGAVGNAASACLGITASVTVFRVIGMLLGKLLPTLKPFISVLCEFSCGVSAGAVRGGIAGAAMTGFAVGFAGLSVLFQTAQFAVPAGISLKPYILVRFSEGAALSLLSAGYAAVRPMDVSGSAAASALPVSISPLRAAAVILLLFFLALVCNRRQNRNFFA